MNVIMTGLANTNDIVDLVASYCQATEDFFNKLYNVLKKYCSGKQKPNLKN